MKNINDNKKITYLLTKPPTYLPTNKLDSLPALGLPKCIYYCNTGPEASQAEQKTLEDHPSIPLYFLFGITAAERNQKEKSLKTTWANQGEGNPLLVEEGILNLGSLPIY